MNEEVVTMDLASEDAEADIAVENEVVAGTDSNAGMNAVEGETGEAGFVEGDAGVDEGETGVIEGDVGAVEGEADVSEGDAGYVEGDTGYIEGDMGFVEGDAGYVEGDMGFVDGGMGEMYGEVGMPDAGMTVKDPLLSNWFFVGGIAALVLACGVALGVLWAKRKIKKGIDLYED